MSAIGSIKTAQPVSLALVANRMDAVLKTVGDAAIGVSRTYDPEGKDANGVMRWVDRSGGIALGYPSISLFVRKPTKTSRVYKVTAKVVLPTLEQTSASTATGIQPAPTKAYDCTCVIDVLLPERSVQWERKALLDTVLSLLATTITASDASPSDSTGTPLRAAIEDFDQPW